MGWFFSKKGEKLGACKAPQAQQKSVDLRAQAMENARAAREAIGEETLNRIAGAMAKKQQSATEQAKEKIRCTEAERVAIEILYMLETRSKH